MADDKIITLKPGQKKLLKKATSIHARTALERNDVGFISRILVQCNLPHRQPKGNVEAWIRKNGKAQLIIKPGQYEKDGKLESYGYPYGNIPRLILFYLCTQAVQTKQRVIPLGETLSEFMHDIGLEVTGGRHGTIQRFKDQLWRLLASSIVFIQDTEERKALQNASIANKAQLWWDVQQPEQGSLFNSYVELSENFMNEIWSFPVPIDLGIVAAIKQSSLALDLYAWLTHRVTYLEKPTRVSWLSLSEQIGSQYGNTKDFKKDAKAALKKISALWLQLEVQLVEGGLELHPSPPSVPLKIT